MVLQSYRQLLRAILFTFKSDTPRIVGMFSTARSYYESNAHVSDASQIQKMIHDSQDAAVFIREGILQGVYDKKTKTVKVKPSATIGDVEIAHINADMGKEAKDL